MGRSGDQSSCCETLEKITGVTGQGGFGRPGEHSPTIDQHDPPSLKKRYCLQLNVFYLPAAQAQPQCPSLCSDSEPRRLKHDSSIHPTEDLLLPSSPATPPLPSPMFLTIDLLLVCAAYVQGRLGEPPSPNALTAPTSKQ